MAVTPNHLMPIIMTPSLMTAIIYPYSIAYSIHFTFIPPFSAFTITSITSISQNHHRETQHAAHGRKRVDHRAKSSWPSLVAIRHNYAKGATHTERILSSSVSYHVSSMGPTERMSTYAKRPLLQSTLQVNRPSRMARRDGNETPQSAQHISHVQHVRAVICR